MNFQLSILANADFQFNFPLNEFNTQNLTVSDYLLERERERKIQIFRKLSLAVSRIVCVGSSRTFFINIFIHH